MFVVALAFEDLVENINGYSGDAYFYVMRKSGGFVGGLGGQMTLTLQDKWEAKVTMTWLKLNLTYS